MQNKNGVREGCNIQGCAVWSQDVCPIASKARDSSDVSQYLIGRNRFQREMQGDDPEAGSEADAEDGGSGGPRLRAGAHGDDDDYHFQTRQINVIAKEREWNN